MELLVVFFIGLFISFIVKACSGNTSGLRPGAATSKQTLEEFEAQVAQMLEPDEVIEASVGYGPCAAVTGKQLYISTKKGIHTIPYREITGLSRSDSNLPFDPRRFVTMTITADKRYYLGNYVGDFDGVYTVLKKFTRL